MLGEGPLTWKALRYRNPTTNNMCSKCYRDTQLTAERKASNSKAAFSALSEVQKLPEVQSLSEVHEVLGAKPASPPPRPQQQSEQHVRETRPADRLPKESSSEEGVKAEASVASTDAGLFQRPAQRPGRCFACNKKVQYIAPLG